MRKKYYIFFGTQRNKKKTESQLESTWKEKESDIVTELSRSRNKREKDKAVAIVTPKVNRKKIEEEDVIRILPVDFRSREPSAWPDVLK